MNDLVKLRARPRLNCPNMLTAWPGIGNVALIVATYLERKLGFKELGEIEASHFFDPVGVLVKNNIVESPKFPQSNFTTGRIPVVEMTLYYLSVKTSRLLKAMSWLTASSMLG